MVMYLRTPEWRQLTLMPIDMMDWLPEDDIIHLIVDAVSLMVLSPFAERSESVRKVLYFLIGNYTLGAPCVSIVN